MHPPKHHEQAQDMDHITLLFPRILVLDGCSVAPSQKVMVMTRTVALRLADHWVTERARESRAKTRNLRANRN